MGDDDEVPAGFTSPPCLLHELDPAFRNPGPDPQRRADVLRWRKAERQWLIEQRLAVPPAARKAKSEVIAQRLDALLGDPAGRVVSAYFPFRGEPELRSWLESIALRGGRGALPVVVRKQAPMVFRGWRRGEALVPGVWNIPIPAAGEEVIPDVVIAPLVGFDRQGYRLGYGGGFFDRTLAALPRRPLVIGVGYASQEIATLYPLPHDIAMSAIVTEDETFSAPPA